MIPFAYHRGYDVREPVEVRISKDELVVLSYPGPDRSVRLADLRAGRALPRRYRNRRIGEFLKELDMTEGRSTGIPKILHAMEINGSPAPVFDFDDDHTYFMCRLPVHPQGRMPEGLTPQVPHKYPTSRNQIEAHEAHVEAHVEAHEPMNDTEMAVLRSCAIGAVSTPELLNALGYGSRTGNFKKALARLLQMGLVEMTLPDRPRSRQQKYRLTARGQAVLKAGGKA